MDELDLRILGELLKGGGSPPGSPVLRKSFRSMAKDLGVDQGTVRNRIGRMQEAGIVMGWCAGVDPGCLGLSIAHVWFDVSPDRDKRALMGKLSSLPGVERVCNFLGPKMSLVVLFETRKELGEMLEQVRRMSGLDGIAWSEKLMRRRRLKLDGLDLSIARSLQEDAWKPYPAIGKELGLSSRTVKRRMAKLADGGVLYLFAYVNLRAVQGILPLQLTVLCDSPAHMREAHSAITRYLGRELVFSDLSETHGVYAVNVANAGRIDEIAAWARAGPGVKDAFVEVILDVVPVRNAYERALERLILAGPAPQRLALARGN